jgi:hypothetical protein
MDPNVVISGNADSRYDEKQVTNNLNYGTALGFSIKSIVLLTFNEMRSGNMQVAVYA